MKYFCFGIHFLLLIPFAHTMGSLAEWRAPQQTVRLGRSRLSWLRTRQRVAFLMSAQFKYPRPRQPDSLATKHFMCRHRVTVDCSVLRRSGLRMKSGWKKLALSGYP